MHLLHHPLHWRVFVRSGRSWAIVFCLGIAFWASGPAPGWARPISVDLDAALSKRLTLVLRGIGDLEPGGRQVFRFSLARPESLDLRVPFEQAPFNGTQLNVQINGRRLVPYFAFGGDTRYDNVKGKPGMRPPLATIEGRWLIPKTWLQKEDNELILWTTGVQPDETLARIGPLPTIQIESLRLGPADGGDLPVYANSIYYDFNIWPQGYPWGSRRHRDDLALVGIINGSGMPPVTPVLGQPESESWKVKRACEDNALGWGMRNQEFYTIWEFAAKPQIWAKYIDADQNPETQYEVHSQTIFAEALANDPAARGADVVLFDGEKYARALEPAIRLLAPYTNYYNFKCEQRGPWGQGFGHDGQRMAEYGVGGELWATNYYEAAKAAHDLVRKYDPDDGRVQEMHFWFYPEVRYLLYDTALRRQQPMGDMIDIFMTHFTGLGTYDYDSEGKPIEGDTFELQYPGGDSGGEKRDHDTLNYPEIAIDFNRFRLGRTEKDMTLGDPQVNRWGNGQPFDYRAGFRGDELIYNSENGVWRTRYSAPAPYQFLHGFFSYSLLPTGASEPHDLKVTKRKSLTETEDHHVNLYGHWIESAGHTKRLRTVDPLYGDLFGWTGQEYCNYGDYISMVGIKEDHHRFPPYDAYGLVRRICYAFITAGPVVPAQLNRGHSDDLFVKCMAQTFDYKPYIGLYAANFDDRPKTFDVTLPFTFPRGTEALVFDDRAWDWKASARKLALPHGQPFRYRTKVPALSAWLVLIPAGPEVLASALDLPAPPVSLSPVPDAAITEDRPTFRWRRGDWKTVRYVVEVAREALFRPQDRVELSEPVEERSYTMRTTPDPEWRYFWRVRAVDKTGRVGLWTRPRAFVYRWPEYSETFPPQEETAPAPAEEETPEVPAWQRLFEEHRFDAPGNLAREGEIFATEGVYHHGAGSRAVDVLPSSYWNNANTLPAEWCVIWRKPVKIRGVKILWFEDRLPSEFTLQVSEDAENWTDLWKQSAAPEPLTEFQLRKPVKAKFFRLYITKSSVESGEIGVREVVIH